MDSNQGKRPLGKALATVLIPPLIVIFIAGLVLFLIGDHAGGTTTVIVGLAITTAIGGSFWLLGSGLFRPKQ